MENQEYEKSYQVGPQEHLMLTIAKKEREDGEIRSLIKEIAAMSLAKKVKHGTKGAQ